MSFYAKLFWNALRCLVTYQTIKKNSPYGLQTFLWCQLCELINVRIRMKQTVILDPNQDSLLAKLVSFHYPNSRLLSPLWSRVFSVFFTHFAVYIHLFASCWLFVKGCRLTTSYFNIHFFCQITFSFVLKCLTLVARLLSIINVQLNPNDSKLY